MIRLKKINRITWQVVNAPIQIRKMEKRFSGETQDLYEVWIDGRNDAPWDSHVSLAQAKHEASRTIHHAINDYVKDVPSN